MSVWSTRRQLTFFVFIVIFLAAVAAGALIWRWPRPSCQDGIKNQSELGVDCGGPPAGGCQAVCPNEARAARVLWARVLPLGTGVYDLAALVENPNSGLALESLPYAFRFTDQNNLFINRVNGTLALAPLEQFVIFASNVDVGRRLPTRAFVDFTGAPIWRRASEKPFVSVSDSRFTMNPSPLLVAKVKNDSLKDYSGVTVAAVLSDSLRNALAASATLVESLPAGETREISFSWPRPFSTEPVFFDLYPHVALAESGN